MNDIQIVSPEELIEMFPPKNMTQAQVDALRELLHGDDKITSNFMTCPFCGDGESADGTTCLRVKLEDDEMYYVECMWCNARGPAGLTEDDAKEKWNSRIPNPKI